MVENLENLCLDKICYNLSLISNVCEWKNYKIPGDIGQKIFDNSFKILNEFNENDLKLFRKEILDLKDVDFYKKQFKDIKYFDFLNGHHLENLIIGNIDKFELLNYEFKLTVNHLQIGKIIYSKIENFDGLETLFLTCKVCESITFEFEDNVTFSNSIYYLMKNSTNTLKLLDLRNIELSLQDLKLIKTIFQKQNYLKELSLNFRDSFGNNSFTDFNTIMECIKYFPITITELFLKIDQTDYQLFKCLSTVFKNLINLKSLYLDTLADKDCLVIDILDNLKEFNSGKLIYLDLTFFRITSLINKHLSQLLFKCSNLNSLYISCNGSENCLDENFVYSLCPLARKIESFYIDFRNIDSIYYSFEELLSKCSSLKSIEIGFFMAIGVEPYFIYSTLNSCKESLISLEFSVCRLKEEFVENIPIVDYCSLEELELDYVTFEGNSLSILLDNLRLSSQNIKCLKFSACNLNWNDGEIIGEYLKYCPNLREIDLSLNENLKTGLNSIIKGLECSRDSIRIIDFSICGIGPTGGLSLISYLRKVKNIEIVRLIGNEIPERYLLQILNNLRNSKRSLVQFNISSTILSYSYFIKIEKLSKTFPSLCFFFNGTTSSENSNQHLLNIISNRIINNFKEFINFIQCF